MLTQSPPDRDTSPWTETCLWFGATLLLLWPLLLNRLPFYFADTPSYLRGGRLAVETALGVLGSWLNPQPAGAGFSEAHEIRSAASVAVQSSGGVRSISYSILAFLFRAPGSTLFALVVLQASTVAYVVIRFQRLFVADAGWRRRLAALMAIATLTTAGWYAAMTSPDIWAGTAIAAAIALVLFIEKVRLAERLLLLGLIAFSISAHASHLAVVVITTVGAMAARRWLRNPTRPAQIAWFFAPIMIGVGLIISLSLVGFGEASISPKRYPISLARSVADGPGRWHLERHCAEYHYAVCDVFHGRFPNDPSAFLWGDHGVRQRATPEQMDRMRDEEMLIIRRAALEYPVQQLSRAVTNFIAQTAHLGIGDHAFGQALTPDVGNRMKLVRQEPDQPLIRRMGDGAIYCVFLASSAFLSLRRKQLHPIETATLAVIMLGLLTNAAVCGILSGVTDRYQGRVAWLLPVMASMVWLRLVTVKNRAGVAMITA